MPRPTRTFPIGLDLGSRCVKVAQLHRRRNGTLTVATEIHPLPHGLTEQWQSHTDDLVELLRELLRAGGFKGRNVVSHPPGQTLTFRNMRLHPRAPAELAEVVHRQCGEYLELSEQVYESRHLDAGEVWEGDERRREVIAMAARLDGLSAYLNLLRRCGLTPMALDAAPAALARSVAMPGSDPADKTLALLDLGYGSSTLTIVRDGHICFVRRLDSGLSVIDDHLSRKFHVSPTEAETIRSVATSPDGAGDATPGHSSGSTAAGNAVDEAAHRFGQFLAREVSKCIQYYCITFRESRPRAGVAFGGGGQQKTLRRAIADGTGIDFQTVGALSDLEWAQSLRDSSNGASPGLWALAAGLSMYGRDVIGERAAA